MKSRTSFTFARTFLPPRSPPAPTWGFRCPHPRSTFPIARSPSRSRPAATARMSAQCACRRQGSRFRRSGHGLWRSQGPGPSGVFDRIKGILEGQKLTGIGS